MGRRQVLEHASGHGAWRMEWASRFRRKQKLGRRLKQRYSGVQASYRLEQEHHPEAVTDPGLAWEHASGHGWWSTKRDSGVMLKQKPG